MTNLLSLQTTRTRHVGSDPKLERHATCIRDTEPGFFGSRECDRWVRAWSYRGESLLQLLVRLDQAIDKALTLVIFTDEINP